MGMLRTAELDMAGTIPEEDVSTFLDDAFWAIRTTHHTVLKASPGAAIFGRDMLFDIPFVADWHKLGIIGNNKLIVIRTMKMLVDTIIIM